MPKNPGCAVRASVRSALARHSVSIIAVSAAASGLASAVHAQPQLDGVWSPVAGWPLIAVHAAITPDGRVLTYGTDGAGIQTAYFIYDIWDPAAGLSGGHMTLNNMTLTDIFCSSQVILPMSGEILIAGGDNWTGSATTNTGNNNSNLFDPSSNTLARSANMNRARWYSSSTVLVNGEVYIQGGNGGGDSPEVRQADGTFRLLTTANTNGYDTFFPRNFVAPDGRVFGYDGNGAMYWVNPAGTGAVTGLGVIPSAYTGWTSGAAMFGPGKILQFGGNSNSAAVIDINGPQPTITPTQSMSTQRQWVSATVLPDGQVLATGGSRVENTTTGVNSSAEIWDPNTGQWHVGSAGARARLYHSSALLLPDATVLVAGGGAPGPQTNTNAEIYYPPYLFDASGALATRPEILLAPTEADVGDTLTIELNTPDISRVTLVKTGSVTHSVNMDQRFIELSFDKSGNVVWAVLPARAAETPPGYYHLFAFDAEGVPSVAKMLRINVDTAPSMGVDHTPALGGEGGEAFELACAVDEVLVGVHGWYDDYLNQVGPQCVQADQFGRWIGDPVARDLAGLENTGTPFNELCPRDAAVSGFRGRFSQFVNQIELQCRALAPNGALSGSGSYLSALGGTGGTAVGLQACGTENPGYALYGRAGVWLDAFGLMCRPGAVVPVATNTAPVIVNPGNQSWLVAAPVELQVEAADADGHALTFSASGLPQGLEIGATTGLITGVPAAPGAARAIISVTDGGDTDIAGFDWTVTGEPLLAVEPIPSQASQLAGTALTYTATAHGGIDVRYKWQFGDGTPETAYDASPSVAHTFAGPGIYFVTLTVNDDRGVAAVQSFVQTIHLAPTPAPARYSANIAYEPRGGGNSRIWVVNQDNDSVSVFDATTNTRLSEIAVGIAPRSIALAPDGNIWVVNNKDATISIISPTTLGVTQTVTLPFASQPFGLVFSPAANYALVVLAGSGAVLKLDATTGAALGTLPVGPNPRHVAVDGAGATAYVSRFVTPPQPGEQTAVVSSAVGGINAGGEVLVIDTASMALLQTIVLQHSDKVDAENQGAGVPNYLGAVAISPDGTLATVPSKQDNIARGTLRSGANLNFQNTVRAISSRLDLAANAEDFSRRIDHDNASVASAAAYDPHGVYLFVALETSREVAVIDAHGGQEIFRIDAGRAPQGLVVSPDGDRLYVNNFMDRTVGVFDLTGLRQTGQHAAPQVAVLGSIVTERLAANVLVGKQFFYDARDTRLARDGYMSCASCHNDGGQDGRVWDLTGMGEGLRNTINLRGPAAATTYGRLHWTQNFDEVQDFEGQIRTLAGGTGLMTNAQFNYGTRSQPLGSKKAGVNADLDALAAYVKSLTQFDPSPHRTATGTLSAEGVTGKRVFKHQNCASCHSGTGFTDSNKNVLRDIGTLKPTSGMRLGQPLTGIDTPTLRSVWRTAPYLHDGSAATIEAAVSAHAGLVIAPADLTALAAYVAQIDSAETTAPVNAAPTMTNPGNKTGIVGKPVSVQIVGNDVDGDPLVYAATGLPAGLGINSSTGLITGVPTAAAAFSVVATVTDGLLTASRTFTYTISLDTTAPAKPGTPTATLVGGKPNLTWTVPTDNVGVTGYIVYRSTSSSTEGAEIGRPTAPTFHDTSATTRTWYYSVRAFDAAGNVSARSGARAVVVP